MELSREQINQLAHELKKRIQQSLTTYIPVSLINKGALQGYSVWVDKWPGYTAVLVQADRSVIKVPYINRLVFIYCQDNKGDGLYKLLTDVLEWRREVQLAGASDDVVKMCDEVFGNPRSKFCQLHKISFISRLFGTCYLLMVTEDTLKYIPKPVDMTEDCVGLDIVDTVSNTWKFGEGGGDEYVKLLIKMEQPSVCLYTKDGTPVAWAIEHIQGTNGILYVQPEYRGRGLAQYTQYALSKKIIKRDGCAFVTIETDNDASLNLHEKIGFRKVDGMIATWKEYALQSPGHS